MSQNNDSEIIWRGRPWVMPYIIMRAILIIAIAVLAVWLEFVSNIAMQQILGVPILLWTLALSLLIWLVSIIGLLITRASHYYILRKQGLEIKTGFIGIKTFMLSAVGFSDLEVTRSAFQRILNTGTIYIRAESEREVKMENVHSPITVSNLLKNNLSRPYFRVEKEEEKR
jgi:membrane protein YdbS with pleckstrin-like domain